MQQLEIQFFFPLTEQIPLDLDYTQPEKPKVWNTGAASGTFLIANGGGGTTWSSIPNITSTFEFKSNPESVGYWEVSEHVHVWRENKPRWLIRTMSRFLLGWKWMDK
jgi:hypothetical protein